MNQDNTTNRRRRRFPDPQSKRSFEEARAPTRPSLGTERATRVSDPKADAEASALEDAPPASAESPEAFPPEPLPEHMPRYYRDRIAKVDPASLPPLPPKYFCRDFTNQAEAQHYADTKARYDWCTDVRVLTDGAHTIYQVRYSRNRIT